ncbi:MAG: ABC transporter ATP-binding protein [Verrucomicrobiota bacterium]
MNDPSEPVIVAEELVRDFPLELKGYRVRAVDNLSFTAGKGRVLGLLGPNGSGKSTTIKMILGLLKPTSGQVRVQGGDPSNRVTRKHIGYLPEAPYFYRFLTGKECVRMMGKLSGLKNKTLIERVDAVVDQVGLSSASNRRVGTYSKGMLQRIGLAQALVHDPDLIILDEPTAGVDPLGTVEIAKMIRTLKESGKTIILCSHLLSEIEGLCDDLLMLYQGTPVFHGIATDLTQSGNIWSFQVSSDQEDTEIAARDALESAGFQWISSNRQVGQSLSEAFVDRIKKLDSISTGDENS